MRQRTSSALQSSKQLFLAYFLCLICQNSLRVPDGHTAERLVSSISEANKIKMRETEQEMGWGVKTEHNIKVVITKAEAAKDTTPYNTESCNLEHYKCMS